MEQLLLLQEPGEKKPANQAHREFTRGLVPLLCGVGNMIRQIGQTDFRNGPSEPVHQIGIEPAVQFLSREDLLPGVIQIGKGSDCPGFRTERLQAEPVQNIEMRAVWVCKGDITDQGHASEHVPGAVAEIAATVDYGHRKRVVVLEEHKDRHRDESVEGARDQ